MNTMEQQMRESAVKAAEALQLIPYHTAKKIMTEAFKATYIKLAEERSGGNGTRAARIAGVERSHWFRIKRELRRAQSGQS